MNARTDEKLTTFVESAGVPGISNGRSYGAPTDAATAAVTKAVVASAVVLLPALCVTPVVPVGSDGVPVNVGEARGAKPEMLAPAGIVTVPVNVGEARGAYVDAAVALLR
jgi:hypothetical protein